MEPVGKEPSVWCAAGAQWRPTRVWMPKRSSSAKAMSARSRARRLDGDDARAALYAWEAKQFDTFSRAERREA